MRSLGKWRVRKALHRRRRDHRRRAHGHVRATRRRRAVVRSVLVVVGVLLVAGVAGGVVVARDALAVADRLESVRARLEQAKVLTLAGDTERATAELTTARAELTRALAPTERPLWSVGEAIPIAGRSLRLIGDVTDVADAATALARDLTDSAGRLLTPGGKLTVTTDGDRIDLAPIRDVRDALATPRLDRLRDARDRLAANSTALVPDRIRAARDEVLGLAADALADISRARDIVTLLPTFLGDDEPREYFLAMQNPAELRGTGGLIGFFATVEAADGRFTLSRPRSYEALNEAPSDIDTTETTAVSEEFDARYGPLNASGFLANTNLDPDLTLVAPVLLDLYERSEGRRLDGVIMVDPLGLRDILQPIGPVSVPADTPRGSLPNPVTADQLPRTVMLDAYNELGGASQQRRTWLRQVATAAFERIFAGGWDALAVSEQVASTAAAGHVQLYSTDEQVQALIEELGIGGRLPPRPPADDWFAFVANNAAGNKGDLFARHHVRGRVLLAPPEDGQAARVGEFSVRVDNGLPVSGVDPYVNSSYALGRAFVPGSRGPDGLNRTWFTLWSDVSTIVTAGDPTWRQGSSTIEGRRGTDWLVETPSGESSQLQATVAGPVTLEPTDDGYAYTLHLRRQPKATADDVLLQVVAPTGWRIVGAVTEGGGDGEGVGVLDDAPRAITTEVDDRQVVVRGDITRSVRVRVELASRGS